MRQIIATLKSVSRYSQSRYHDTPKLEKESDNDYEMRTWRNRLHVTDKGYVFMPPQAFKNCISGAAKYIGMKVPGKGNNLYTKHFVAGVLVTDPLVLDILAEDVEPEWLYVNPKGIRGGATRVPKCFPLIHEWGGDVIYHVLDDTITEDVFRYHLEQAGKFIGVGRFRPINNGFYGRFEVADLVVENL